MPEYGILQIACDFSKFTSQVREATKSLRELSEVLKSTREHWLCMVGGEWPDRFVLLNRYLRTGAQSEYFTDERWSS